MDEKWLPIVGYEGYYEVSNTGRIRSIERIGMYQGRWKETEMKFPAREMAIATTKAGYKYVSLKLPNMKGVKYLVHRLVMRAFVGKEPADKVQVNHKDGKKDNNNLYNLEYCSSQENLLHLTRVLKRKIGGAGGYSKLTEVQAMEIIGDHRTLKEIAMDYGVSLQAIWYIRKGRNWSHLQGASA